MNSEGDVRKFGADGSVERADNEERGWFAESEIKFRVDENAVVYNDGTAVIDGRKSRYINPLNDIGFKILFGSENVKEHLIGLLNALFSEKNIVDLHYLSTEHMPWSEKGRKSVFDVMCETDAGEKFIVELQKAEQANFIDRTFYYATFVIQEQAKTGKDWMYELKPVITVGLLNFLTFDGRFREGLEQEGVYKFSFRSDDNGEKLTDNLSFAYIEIPRGRDRYSEDMTYIEKWMYLFKHLGRLTDRPAEVQDRVFESIFRKAEIAAMTKDEFNTYVRDMRTELDTICQLDFALKKGINQGIGIGREQGLEEGREEGAQNRNIEIARGMKVEGLDIALIIKLTGLTKEEIGKL